MSRRRKSFARSLLLVMMLVIGPVHAQIVYACNMMDIVQDTCCCDPYELCDDTLITESESCCEQSIELTSDHSLQEIAPSRKQIELRSDVDPPPTIIIETNFQGISSPVYAVLNHNYQITHSSQFGAQIYLTTQRLRI